MANISKDAHLYGRARDFQSPKFTPAESLMESRDADLSKDAHVYGKAREFLTLKWAPPGSLLVAEDENGVKSLCFLNEENEPEAVFSIESGEAGLDEEAAAKVIEMILRDGPAVETE